VVALGDVYFIRLFLGMLLRWLLAVVLRIREKEVLLWSEPLVLVLELIVLCGLLE